MGTETGFLQSFHCANHVNWKPGSVPVRYRTLGTPAILSRVRTTEPIMVM